MPIPDGMNDDDPQVYHISDGGTTERLKTTVSGSGVSFVMDNFSDHVFADRTFTGGSTDGNADNNNSPNSSSGGSPGPDRETIAKSIIPGASGFWDELANGK